MKKENTKKIIGIVTAVVAIASTVAGLLFTMRPNSIVDLNDPEIKQSMTYDQVQPGEENVSNSPYIQFDAFFLRDLDGDGYAEKIRGTCRAIDKTDTLYVNLNVLTNGDFVDGKLTINGQNMQFKTALVEDNVISGNYLSDNTTQIHFKDMHNGTQKLLYGTVKASALGNDTTKYSKINSITLTGTHVADDGTRTPISKTVSFQVDWHAEIACGIYNYTNYTQDINKVINEEGKTVDLSFNVTTEETKGQAVLKGSYFEATIPELNGYKPTKVEVTGNNVTYDYNEETGKLTSKRENTLKENGTVSESISRRNTYTIHVSYPLEAYETLGDDTISLQIPTQSYYEGYNNPSEEFQNPIKSNVVDRTFSFLWRKLEGEVARFDVTVGKYRSFWQNDRWYQEYVVSKEEPLKLYNQTEETTKDTYEVRWYAYTGSKVEIDSLQMKEQDSPYTDQFQNNAGTYLSMQNYTSNIGIYFSGADNTLGEEGYIQVINDETGEILHTFTKEDWNNYNSESPYKYETPVQHIRIETSNVNQNSSFYVYHVKELNDTKIVEDFTREEFDELSKIYSYVTGKIKSAGQTEYTIINSDQDYAIYEEPVSVASLKITRDTFGTQKEEKDVNIAISTLSNYYNMKKWTNGSFLVTLPEEILDIQINNITIDNNHVNILAYEIIEKDGKKCIKVETENDTEEIYTININANITVDPRALTVTKTAELYAVNQNYQNYKNKKQDIYDLNANGNTTEMVGYSSDAIHLVAPSSLLTNQQATNYNEKGETAVAPQIATIDKVEADTATVNVSVTNNYAGTISEVVILGKIPFEGNTFTLNGTSLNSNYTTQMTNSGITLPTELQGIATVYYSENENPTKDLTDTNNGWTQTPQDFSKVKTYLIDLGDYTLSVRENKVFTYQIKVPTTVQYNDISYSTHAVYFCLDTAEGKFATQTETSKLGFSIERKYNLTLAKTKENTSVAVQGAIFTITEEGSQESKMGTTSDNGSFTIENLYVDKTYLLKEIRTPSAYEKQEREVKFKVTVQNDQLALSLLEGESNLLTSSLEQATSEKRGTLHFAVENTPKYKVVLTKKDEASGAPLKGIKYKLEGKGMGTGITVTTNKEGSFTVSGLSHDEIYTLTEIAATGYYVEETPVQFKVVKNGSKLEFVVVSGSFHTQSAVVTGTGISGMGAQDTVNVELTDEKIPTYSIALKKYAKGEETLLKNAQYKIEGEGIPEGGAYYLTDENGTLTIEGLYEYVAGKNITGVYTITEITPPEGYALNNAPLQFKAERNAEGALEVQMLQNGTIRTIGEEKDITIANNTITFGLEDETLFKITKVDAKTKLPIANAKFVLKEVDETLKEIGYAQDINGNTVGELVEQVGAGTLTFSSEGETYPWTQREDGTWESGGKAINNAESNMTSNEFTLKEDGSITFDWSVSSESVSYDYVYYTITNTKTGTTIGGTSTKIGGTTNGTVYESLNFSTVSVDLEKGSYTIQFTYKKDGSGDTGLDAGFVRNISVEGIDAQIPVVTTNEKGEITEALKAGLYKAVEIETPEGYELPEDEKDRTYYFGIGTSKPQESTFGVSWTNTVAGYYWNKVNAVAKTSDGGTAVTGFFTQDADLNGDGVVDVSGPAGQYSGFIAKYAADGNMEFAVPVTSDNGEVELEDIIQTRDGKYAAVGYIKGSTLKVGDKTSSVASSGYTASLIVIIENSGGLYTAKIETNAGNSKYTNIVQTQEGQILCAKEFGNIWYIVEKTEDGTTVNSANGVSGQAIEEMAMNMNNEAILVTTSTTATTSGAIYKYSDGTATKVIDLDFNPTSITRLESGKFIISGNYTGTAQTVATAGNYDGILVEYDDSTATLSNAKFIRGAKDDVITSASKTEDGGYLVGGYTYSSTVDLNNDGTDDITSISGNSDGFVIKYNEEGTMEWYKQVSGADMDEVTDVVERANSEYVAVGYFNSATLSADKASNTTDATLSQYTDGFIANYGEIITSPEVPEKSNITVENKLKQYRITTDVKEVNGVKGGTISGEDQAPYEIVEYGKGSTKEIKMVPDAGYKIVNITINDEEYKFVTEEDGSVILPAFTNMNANKHIVVEYSNTASSILIHHYLDGTETSVAPDENKGGTIGKTYTTAPYMDLEKYELKKDANGTYIIPSNASGTYTSEVQVITYYYVEKQIPLTVHHYIEGTENPVPLADGSTAQDVTAQGKEGTTYTTSPIAEAQLNAKYDIIHT